MKTIRYTTLKFLFYICLSIGIYSCQDVIDVEVPTAPPRLVIEASLDWEKGTSGNIQEVQLSKSSAYFDTTTDTSVTGASVKITKDDGTEFFFTDLNNGTYQTTTFIPEIESTYTLEVIYNNETYIATETLKPVVEIAEVTQSFDGGFDDEALEVNVLYDDPVAEENYYVIEFKEVTDFAPFFLALDDEFNNGNRFEIFYEKEDENDDDDLLPGDQVEIALYGVSEQYYNYMVIFSEITEDDNAGPFSSVPVQLRGNCVNTTNAENYPFGYFRVTEVDKTLYTVQ